MLPAHGFGFLSPATKGRCRDRLCTLVAPDVQWFHIHLLLIRDKTASPQRRKSLTTKISSLETGSKQQSKQRDTLHQSSFPRLQLLGSLETPLQMPAVSLLALQRLRAILYQTDISSREPFLHSITEMGQILIRRTLV